MPNTAFIITAALLAATAAMQVQMDDAPSSDSNVQAMEANPAMGQIASLVMMRMPQLDLRLDSSDG